MAQFIDGSFIWVEAMIEYYGSLRNSYKIEKFKKEIFGDILDKISIVVVMLLTM